MWRFFDKFCFDILIPNLGLIHFDVPRGRIFFLFLRHDIARCLAFGLNMIKNSLEVESLGGLTDRVLRSFPMSFVNARMVSCNLLFPFFSFRVSIVCRR